MKDLPYEAEAVTRYINGDKSTEIKRDLGISSSQLYSVLRRNNVQFRQPNNAKSHTNSSSKKTKVCPKCKAKNNPAQARFCCMCGADIRSDEDLCIERLGVALKNCLLLPENVRDETTDAIQQAIMLLKKH